MSTLYFNMSPDPDERRVRCFDTPLCPRVLVVGDFFARPDNRPVDDRPGEYVDRRDIDRLARQYKLTNDLWRSLRSFVQDTPDESHIDCVNASPTDLLESFEDSPRPAKSAFSIMVNPYDHQGMRPYSLVVVLDVVDGDLLRRMAEIGRRKNVPILVEKAGVMDTTDPAAKFVVPCPSGALETARATLFGFTNKTPLPDIMTSAGTTFSALVLQTHIAQQVLHVDYHRRAVTESLEADAMMHRLNQGLSRRLQHLPDVSAKVSDFVWKDRPTAEAMLLVTTPELSVEDHVVLQFEYA